VSVIPAGYPPCLRQTATTKVGCAFLISPKGTSSWPIITGERAVPKPDPGREFVCLKCSWSSKDPESATDRKARARHTTSIARLQIRKVNRTLFIDNKAFSGKGDLVEIRLRCGMGQTAAAGIGE
jgi:hypothetical protein